MTHADDMSMTGEAADLLARATAADLDLRVILDRGRIIVSKLGAEIVRVGVADVEPTADDWRTAARKLVTR